MTDLCATCEKERECTEPFPHSECDDYVRKFSDAEVISLFRMLRPSMKKAIVMIMETVIEDDRKRGRTK